jgi:CsoR family transcriptional regulator, copper-sensing transcriptional repressor
MFPSHDDQIVRLNRIEGQIRGIRKMIEENRYCIDIIHQCTSVGSALNQVKKNILRRHLNHCVMNAFTGGGEAEINQKIEEVVSLLDFMSKK